jgi:SAM-dependent methyltransferase
MTRDMHVAVEERLTRLLQHLGLTQAHFAARTVSDWQGLATTNPERITSLTLICPPVIDVHALRSIASRCLLVIGDRGPAAERVRGASVEFTAAKIVDVPDYSGLVWDDAIADHTETISLAMLDFLEHMSQHQGLPSVKIAESAGEHAGLFYRIRGEGPPLVLLPLGLAPSQWEPMLPTLARHYCTIILGGPALGTVSILESRSRAGYLSVVRRLVDEMAPQPGESILEVGCGSGALTRWLAQHTPGAQRLVGVDVNPYLLSEARGIAHHENLDGMMTFQEGRADTLPFSGGSFNITMSCTMLEEVDADRALAELVRVTSPGGRIGVIVRALDMPWWVNLPVEASLKTVLESSSRLGAGVQAQGCADASLYKRLKDIGLSQVRMFPQWAIYTEGAYFQVHREKLLMNLSPEDTHRGQEALAQANADGTFFMAEPFHCAVGTKL